MNAPAQSAASADERTPSNSAEKKTHAPKFPPSRGLAPVLMMAAGGLLTSIVVSAGMGAISTGQDATLGSVPKDQLDGAIVSLAGQAAATTITEIKDCKVPLAFVTVSAEAGATASASTIRLRSGSYISPPLLLTPSPLRVAVPFPAPYPSGKGVLFVEGIARGLNVWLTPGTHYSQINGPTAINVVWVPKVPPC
jgi:hypothetical protein